MRVLLREEVPVSPAQRTRPAGESNPGVAALLASVLSDDDAWTTFTASRDDDDARDAMALRAVELYRASASYLRSRDDPGGAPEPIDRAVALLRQIADACALESHRWTGAERKDLRIPTRATLAAGARRSGLGDWLAGLGHPVELRASIGDPPAVWPAVAPGESYEDELATRFGDAVTLYELVMEARGVPRGWDLLRTEVFRRGACQEVAVARAWLLRMQEQTVPGVRGVAHATLLMGQMFFVASRDATRTETLFPGREFLGELLERSGGEAWLREHGADVPDWLA